MQHQRAMCVDDRLRHACRARREKHRGAIVLVEHGIDKVVVFACDEFVVIKKPRRNIVTRIAIDDHFLKTSTRSSHRFVDRKQSVIDDQKSRARVLRDRRKLLGMKPQIKRIDDAACAGNAEEKMHVSRVGPHHRADAVAGEKPEPSQSGSRSAGAAMKISISRARHNRRADSGIAFQSAQKENPRDPVDAAGSVGNPSSCRACENLSAKCSADGNTTPQTDDSRSTCSKGQRLLP